MIRPKNSLGFSAVEMLLILVIVGILGFTGWFVYHARQTTNKDLSSNNSTIPTFTKKTDTNESTAAKAYITITDWGVRAQYSGSLSLTYKISTNTNGESTANFTSKQLTDANAGCSDFGGKIVRYTPSDKVGPSNVIASEFFKTADKSTFSYLDGYYYFFKHDDSLCSAVSSTSDPAAAIQTQTNNAVKSITPILEAIPVTK